MHFTQLLSDLFIRSSKKHIVLIVALSTLLVMSCTTTQQVQEHKIERSPLIKETTPISAKKLILKAKKSEPIAANLSLITAAKYYLLEDNPQKALWLSEHLLSLEQTIEHQYQLHIISAQASVQLNEILRAEEQLAKCELLSVTANLPHSYNFYLIRHTIHQHNNEDVAALNDYLNAFSLNTNTNINDVSYIWKHIASLSDWQQVQLANLKAPLVNGWVALTTLANTFSDNKALTTALKQWQKEFPEHPANNILEHILQPLEKTDIIKNIAILLPLSGKQESVGRSAQEGILAAYTEKNQNSSTQDIKLTFIDTNTTSFDLLPENLLSIKAEYVIGPLLKRHVKKYLANNELILPTLLLNIPENTVLLPQQVALSMRPEDEAIQAATRLSQNNFKHPIILSHQDNVSLRIANAFSAQWEVLNGHKPTIQSFEQGNAMQDVIKTTLAIDQSQNRIKSLRVKLRETLKIEARNRRDIDMFYIVATPNQTRLLKPYIDVNISPFAKRIPVFASSRSHSIQKNKSTLNDLRGLTFTQIPLLLESQQQNKALAHTNTLLWPKRNDKLQPVFAMGYDSLNLLDNLPNMKERTYLRYFGQTGTLMLNNKNILTRSLTWGRYQRDKVSEIVLE